MRLSLKYIFKTPQKCIFKITKCTHLRSSCCIHHHSEQDMILLKNCIHKSVGCSSSADTHLNRRFFVSVLYWKWIIVCMIANYQMSVNPYFQGTHFIYPSLLILISSTSYSLIDREKYKSASVQWSSVLATLCSSTPLELPHKAFSGCCTARAMRSWPLQGPSMVPDSTSWYTP